MKLGDFPFQKVLRWSEYELLSWEQDSSIYQMHDPGQVTQ